MSWSADPKPHAAAWGSCPSQLILNPMQLHGGRSCLSQLIMNPMQLHGGRSCPSQLILNPMQHGGAVLVS